jgi:hypothetical protein
MKREPWNGSSLGKEKRGRDEAARTEPATIAVGAVIRDERGRTLLVRLGPERGSGRGNGFVQEES